MNQTDDRIPIRFEHLRASILSEIEVAQAKLALLQKSEKERRAYESFLLSRASALDVLGRQYQLGKEEGIEAGKNEANRENARKMRAKGFAPSEIIDITGLTEAEIQAL